MGMQLLIEEMDVKITNLQIGNSVTFKFEDRFDLRRRAASMLDELGVLSNNIYSHIVDEQQLSYEVRRIA